MTGKFAIAPLFVLSVVAPLGAEDAPPALRAAVHRHLAADVGVEEVTFQYSLVDLNGDAVLDAVVLMTLPSFCGSGGCNMFVFRGRRGGFAFLSGSTITNAPIRVTAESRHGWKTLIVHVRGGGVEPSEVALRFDGRRYPLNPSVQPAATARQLREARIVLAR